MGELHLLDHPRRPRSVNRDGTRKSRANSEPARVYKLASWSTLTGPDFAFDFFVPSRLTAAGLDLNTERVGLPVAQC